MTQPCATCGKSSSLLCDGKVVELPSGLHRLGRKLGSNVPRMAKTCDAPICKDCRVKISDIHLRTNKGGRWDTIDLCPLCAAENKETK